MNLRGAIDDRRKARHRRVRKKLAGLPGRPRLCVFRSQKHLYAQLVDDMAGKSLLGWSTKDKRLKLSNGSNTTAAKELGSLVAADISKRGITNIVFDRGGYVYHGRVKALAEAVRAGGLKV